MSRCVKTQKEVSVCRYDTTMIAQESACLSLANECMLTTANISTRKMHLCPNAKKLLDSMIRRPALDHHSFSAKITPSQASQDPTAQPKPTGASSASARSTTANPSFSFETPPATTGTNSGGGLRPGREYFGRVVTLGLGAILMLKKRTSI